MKIQSKIFIFSTLVSLISILFFTIFTFITSKIYFLENIENKLEEATYALDMKLGKDFVDK